jgi:cyclic pyranopterin phosphate synthase
VPLSHVDEQGGARMVDVGAKAVTARVATAEGVVVMSPEAFALVRDNAVKKGDVLTLAKVAGITGAKKTAELIPLCHPLPLDAIAVDAVADATLPGVRVTATARATARTGVEMEALAAVAAACLTVYDMVKAVDRRMRIEGVRVTAKSGGAHDFDAHRESSGEGGTR